MIFFAIIVSQRALAHDGGAIDLEPRSDDRCVCASAIPNSIAGGAVAPVCRHPTGHSLTDLLGSIRSRCTQAVVVGLA